MANFNDALRAEISRLVRKSTKADFEHLRKQLASQRHELSLLKRESKELRGQLKKALGTIQIASPKQEVDIGPALVAPRDFGPQTLVALRRKLGLSQEHMALLLNCSSLSVSRWETGKAVPRRVQLAKILEVRAMSKQDADQTLAKLR